MNKFLLLLACMAIFMRGQSQEKPADSVTVTTDTTLIQGNPPIDTIKSYSNRYDPRKALLYAAVLPGSGQIYNKKYWKLPLVWGGLGLLVYSVNYYQQAYVKYKDELYITINDPTAVPPSGLQQEQLRSIVDQARRQRDFMLVLTGFVYMLQIVDAHVDAHLKEFDLNPKLKASIQPKITSDLMMGRSAGLSFILRF